MKIRKSDISRIILPCSILIIVFCIIFMVVTKRQFDVYNKIYNDKTESIIGVIKEKYPDVDDKAIIEIIQNDDFQAKGKDFLSNYGYDGNELNYLASLKSQMNKNTIINITCIVIFGIAIMSVGMIYSAKQNKKISKIDMYLKKINNGKYDLKIEENVDDELSKLSNELYKTTILLREAAENSKKESKNLSIALEDISHQLKTPLTSIRIMIDNIYENPDMDEQTRKDFMQTISKQIDWISSLVISLLKLAKFDSGTIVMNRQEFLVKDLLNQIVENLSIMLEIKNIKVNIDMQENIKANLDYNWQLEALTNIIKNSIEHSKENSSIDIKVEDSSVFLKIIITDYGEGISKKDINHIFERFYKTKNMDENSIGIGLSLSKAIIEKDNGYISVNSKETKGTTFTIKYIK